MFERQWALTLLERVYARLEEQYVSEGKQDLFEHLKPCLMQASSAVPYTELSQTLSQTEGALRVAVHRLRKRYRDLLRNEIAHTVADSTEVEDEIQHLFRILSR